MQKKAKINKWLVILIMVVILVLLAIGVYALFGEKDVIQGHSQSKKETKENVNTPPVPPEIESPSVTENPDVIENPNNGDWFGNLLNGGDEDNDEPENMDTEVPSPPPMPELNSQKPPILEIIEFLKNLF